MIQPKLSARPHTSADVEMRVDGTIIESQILSRSIQQGSLHAISETGRTFVHARHEIQHTSPASNIKGTPVDSFEVKSIPFLASL